MDGEITLKNVLSEKDLMDLLALNKDQISRLRAKGLPFVRLNERHRLYFEHDLVEHFLSKRVVLDASD